MQCEEPGINEGYMRIEIPVGTEILINGTKFSVVIDEDYPCRDCAFQVDQLCGHFVCNDIDRQDGNDIHFEKVSLKELKNIVGGHMKIEIPVGTKLLINGTKYAAVIDDHYPCEVCAFCSDPICGHFACCERERHDGKAIHFEKLI